MSCKQIHAQSKTSCHVILMSMMFP